MSKDAHHPHIIPVRRDDGSIGYGVHPDWRGGLPRERELAEQQQTTGNGVH